LISWCENFLFKKRLNSFILFYESSRILTVWLMMTWPIFLLLEFLLWRYSFLFLHLSGLTASACLFLLNQWPIPSICPHSLLSVAVEKAWDWNAAECAHSHDLILSWVYVCANEFARVFNIFWVILRVSLNVMAMTLNKLLQHCTSWTVSFLRLVQYFFSCISPVAWAPKARHEPIHAYVT
jgi:hypothetical protein